MSGFTKGPWAVQAAEDCTGRQLDPLTKWVVTAKEHGLWISTGPTWDAEYAEESEANARLIASSPELYEAGKRVTNAFRAMGNAAGMVKVRDARIECEQAMLALDAALSKAAGEGR